MAGSATMCEEQDKEAGLGPAEEVTQAIVESIDDGVAIVLVGDGMEEWDFPAHLLPDGAVEGSVLLLAGTGRDVRIVGLGAGRDSVEGRLDRGLSKKRPISLPLPHRPEQIEEPEPEPIDRPSRMIRGLNHRG